MAFHLIQDAQTRTNKEATKEAAKIDKLFEPKNKKYAYNCW